MRFTAALLFWSILYELSSSISHQARSLTKLNGVGLRTVRGSLPFLTCNLPTRRTYMISCRPPRQLPPLAFSCRPFARRAVRAERGRSRDGAKKGRKRGPAVSCTFCTEGQALRRLSGKQLHTCLSLAAGAPASLLLEHTNRPTEALQPPTGQLEPPTTEMA